MNGNQPGLTRRKINHKDAVISSWDTDAQNAPAYSAPPLRRRSWAGCAVLLAILAGVTFLLLRRTRPSSGHHAASVLLTAEELSKFNGEGRAGIYVAVLGSVFDVAAGRRHYGPGGGYSAFAGRDATRAFVTGKFSEDLTDDIADFTAEQHADVVGWRQFYLKHKEYRHVGRVVGRFYDADGDPTPLLILAETHAERHAAVKAAQEAQAAAAEDERNPCNVSWSRVRGGWVHCSEGQRPRLVLVSVGENAGNLQERCVCFAGDEADEARRLYEGCAPTSENCQTSPPEVE